METNKRPVRPELWDSSDGSFCVSQRACVDCAPAATVRSFPALDFVQSMRVRSAGRRTVAPTGPSRNNPAMYSA